MEFISEFPELGRGDLRDFKKAVDQLTLANYSCSNSWAGLAWLTKLEARCWFGRLFYRYRFFWHVGKHHGHPSHHFGGDLYLYRAWYSAWYMDGQIKPCSIDYHPCS